MDECSAMRSRSALVNTLHRIDGRGYKAYQEIRGATRLDERTHLLVDHVQGDPFAAPSMVRVRVDREVPAPWTADRLRQVAVEDWFARRVARHVRSGRRAGSGKSGQVEVDAPGQEVLERTTVRLKPGAVEVRLKVGLPARGRSVLGRQAVTLLTEHVPDAVHAAVHTSPDDLNDLWHFVHTVENQAHLRAQLAERGLVAFVGDGSILPRESGISDRPMKDAIPFRWPEAESPRTVELSLRHPEGGSLRGLGLPEGVTLVVGGGYHGKSTLLEAMQRGVYDHAPGDGRQTVVCRSDAVKIRAEDGRRVESVDISGFIQSLPSGHRTDRFRSDDASGSTSQAAALVEALEAGSTLLLMDEDTSATNFMIRDARMQALVAREDEPIVPFVDRVRELWDRFGVSTILVMGGSGDYFRHADAVVQMKNYRPIDVTDKARSLAGTERDEDAPSMAPPRARVPRPEGLDPSRGKRSVKIDAPRDEELRFGETTVDLRALEQCVDRSQVRAIGACLHQIRRFMDGRPIPEVLDALESHLDVHGIDVLGGGSDVHPGDLARPRRQEVAAALSRHRGFRCRD